MRFLGLPLVMWGIGCLALAVVWAVVWPNDRVRTASGTRFVILRWFHALTWLLLAIAAFLASFNFLGGAGSARVVALVSLIVYLIFMATFVLSRSAS